MIVLIKNIRCHTKDNNRRANMYICTYVSFIIMEYTTSSVKRHKKRFIYRLLYCFHYILKVLNLCVLSVMTYGDETWILTVGVGLQIQDSSLMNGIRNEIIR